MKRLKLIILFLGLGFASVVQPVDGVELVDVPNADNDNGATPNTGTGIKVRNDGDSDTSFDEAMNTLSDPTVPDNEDSFGYQSDDEDSRPTSPITINNDENDGASSIGAGPRVSNGIANKAAQESVTAGLDFGESKSTNDTKDLLNMVDMAETDDHKAWLINELNDRQKGLTSEEAKQLNPRIDDAINKLGDSIDWSKVPTRDNDEGGYLDVKPDDDTGNEGGYLDTVPEAEGDGGGYMDPAATPGKDDSGYLDPVATPDGFGGDKSVSSNSSQTEIERQRAEEAYMSKISNGLSDQAGSRALGLNTREGINTAVDNDPNIKPEDKQQVKDYMNDIVSDFGTTAVQEKSGEGAILPQDNILARRMTRQQAESLRDQILFGKKISSESSNLNERFALRDTDESGYLDPTQPSYLDVKPDDVEGKSGYLDTVPEAESDEPDYLDVNPDELNDEGNNVSETPYSEEKVASVNGPQLRFATPTEQVPGGSMFAPADQLIPSTDAASDVDSINSGMDEKELEQRLRQIIELGVSKSRGGGKFAIDHLDDLLNDNSLSDLQKDQVEKTLDQYAQYIKNRRKWFFKSKLDGNAFYDHENGLTSQEKKDLKRNRDGKIKNKDALKRIRATQGSLILEDARPSDVPIGDWGLDQETKDQLEAMRNYAASDEPKNTGYYSGGLFGNDNEW